LPGPTRASVILRARGAREVESNVIVMCPSCHTRYRHAPPVDGGPNTARCGSCDEVFPFAPPRRQYVLLPLVSRPSSLARNLEGKPVGLDDPTLAEQIRARTESEAPAALLEREAPAPLLEREALEPPPRAAAFDRLAPVPEPTIEETEHEHRPAADAEAAAAETPQDEETCLDVEATSEALPSAAPSRRRVNALTELTLAFGPAVIGASLAYARAAEQGADAASWGALGGAVGMLVGWGCLLWVRARR
jgi:hypothetical protein